MKINRELIYKKFNGHCAYCGKEIKFKDMQIDHFDAKINNHAYARDLLGNLIYPDPDRYENLMPSCRRCNHYKRAHPINYYRDLINSIRDRIRNDYLVRVAEDYGLIEFKNWDKLFYFEKQNP